MPRQCECKTPCYSNIPKDAQAEINRNYKTLFRHDFNYIDVFNRHMEASDPVIAKINTKKRNCKEFTGRTIVFDFSQEEEKQQSVL